MDIESIIKSNHVFDNSARNISSDDLGFKFFQLFNEEFHDFYQSVKFDHCLANKIIYWVGSVFEHKFESLQMQKLVDDRRNELNTGGGERYCYEREKVFPKWISCSEDFKYNSGRHGIDKSPIFMILGRWVGPGGHH